MREERETPSARTYACYGLVPCDRAQTNVTEWKWIIEPTKEGTQSLHLTLSALLDVQGRQMPRVIRTFERTIDVRSSVAER